MESGIEGPLFNVQQLAGCLLDVENDSIAVHGIELREAFENEEIESSLKVVLSHVHPP